MNSNSEPIGNRRPPTQGVTLESLTPRVQPNVKVCPPVQNTQPVRNTPTVQNTHQFQSLDPFLQRGHVQSRFFTQGSRFLEPPPHSASQTAEPSLNQPASQSNTSSVSTDVNSGESSSRRMSETYQVPVFTNQHNSYRRPQQNQTMELNPHDNPFSSDREKKAHDIAKDMGLTGREYLGFVFISNGLGFL